MVDRSQYDMSTECDGCDTPIPGWKPSWKKQRTLKFRKCAETNKRIWPFTKAWVRLRNSRIPSNEWLSNAGYTFRKLKNKL